MKHEISITRLFIGWEETYGAWRYEFNVDHNGRQFSVPILISNECPEEDRVHHANENFREWAAKVAEEAAKL